LLQENDYHEPDEDEEDVPYAIDLAAEVRGPTIALLNQQLAVVKESVLGSVPDTGHSSPPL
jgi:hypothetical protein